ncbi:MAG: adenylate/guanylate cyclase domain-containing protein [Zetaproteobacteria bacterium CG_4_9_14_3_um_filter_49_83]|nr:MAG: adenylate/guanylate cyclase domain-containing protein [Zetaproteobacteria bacterium CG1_02_49_23]PIQ31347.1 MAG: adenylate/guanylate cyclase domain-containing protein [Zetaproteobacteria bacterium CG17_big_fil_post_rev_8_21_14_2_50_50_13]PIY55377.1 MAG: adenylate/guanylate cyclase domain-containing protein [Zetaproteobacteria bacterium CG_4_10_14_0_8_um_filter_49_80]PJA34931.1 MAG: adenylate/guanylate cyclase domain-containing protein [Zetaproteobacteria bacterium CG_4_9_14_3_um_filter_4
MIQTIAKFIEKHQQWFRFPLVVCMSVLALVIAFTQPYFAELIELKSLDERFVVRGPITPNKHVVIVAVDNNSLTEVGRWPWSRDKISTIVDKIFNEYGAAAIGFDMVFSEAQLNPLEESLRLLENSGNKDKTVTKWLGQHADIGDVDAGLEKIFKTYHDRIVPGYFFYPEGSSPPSLAVQHLNEQLDFMQMSAMTAELSKHAELKVPRMAAIEGNLPRFSKQADMVGFFNFFPDGDGMIRRIPLVAERDAYIYPSMDMQALRIFLEWPMMSVKVNRSGVDEIVMGKKSIRTDESGSMLLNHYGPGNTFPHIPAADVLMDRVDGSLLKGAIVILGVTATGVYDYRPTPFDPIFPGVEGHAAAISNILNDEEISRPGYLDGIELVVVLLLGLLCGRLVIGRGPTVQTIVMFIIPISLVGFAFWMFIAFGVWIKVTYMVIAVLMATVPITLLDYFVESRKRAFIHDAFAHYLSPEVVETLSRNPERLKLGGEERHMTAFFSDIASFSTFSEKLSPTELVGFLNLYLSAMSDIILARGGTIDKYEGDAVIAFFGAPLDMTDHAVQCVMAAVEQQQALRELRVKWSEMGYPEVNIRIGMNSGPMLVGNMGTHNSMNYTMMGDHVNLAARLEGVCKQYKVLILISRDTYVLVRDEVSARFVDRVRVVGRSQPVDLYEPLGARGTVDEERIKLSRAYERAWGYMQNRMFNEAEKLMLGLVKRVPDDGLYLVMLERIRGFIKNPPPEDWSGIHNLDSK